MCSLGPWAAGRNRISNVDAKFQSRHSGVCSEAQGAGGLDHRQATVAESGAVDRGFQSKFQREWTIKGQHRNSEECALVRRYTYLQNAYIIASYHDCISNTVDY